MLDTLFANISDQMGLLLRVAIAMVLGALIGIEREYADKPAGLRTHMLVAGAAALLVGLADVLAQRFTAETYAEILRADPIRIVEAVITGVSFLGAGTIFRRNDAGVEGLTTAASLLVVSAIGIAVALDQFVLALCVTVLGFVVLRLIRIFEQRRFGDKD